MQGTETDVQWLDRALTVCAWSYCLCLSEEEFYSQLSNCGESRNCPGGWIRPGAHAITHYFPETAEHAGIAIVCMDRERADNYTGIQTAALLCHEAVHIWQRHAESIGSFNDHGDEEEAYAIQNIAQCLMEEWARRVQD